jgi:Putative zinc finger motif, C2HC5-type
LLDYLVQLLGSDRHRQLLNFVGNVERFQNGTDLLDERAEIVEKVEEEDALSVAKKPALVTLTTKTPKQRLQAKKEVDVSKTSSSGASKSASATSAASKQVDPAPKLSNRNKKKAALEESEAAKLPEPRKPSQGKASIECGCFGSLHHALTNCLHCGRISCAKEGYDYCPFCGFLVEEVTELGGSGENVEYVGVGAECAPTLEFSPLASVHSSGALTCRLTLGNRKDDAWIHKERLLRYDREVAQRTVVVDDQADYYSNATSVWLTENERNEAAAQEKQRQEDIHLRKKMQLNLAL